MRFCGILNLKYDRYANNTTDNQFPAVKESDRKMDMERSEDGFASDWLQSAGGRKGETAETVLREVCHRKGGTGTRGGGHTESGLAPAPEDGKIRSQRRMPMGERLSNHRGGRNADSDTLNKLKIMGILKRFRQWCKTRKQLKRLHGIGSVFNALDKLEKGHMLSFDEKNRRLFIEEPLALVMMAGGAERWSFFIQNCFVWLYHRQCAENWGKYVLKEELEAVRMVSKQYAVMTMADIERVRRARRDEILQGDIEPPKVEPFEFFVVRAAAEPSLAEEREGDDDPSEIGRTDNGGKAKKGTVPAGEILAVGRYDPEAEHLEIAPWDEVSLYLKREEESKKKKKK